MYIHVPFCKSRCIYCDFYSQTLGGDVMDDYVKALVRETGQRSDEAEVLSTIYFGGGTPSVLSLSHVRDILACVRTHYYIDKGAEITFEANPDDIGEEYVSGLLDLGINRISLGVQSFDDDVLRLLRRRHTAAQAQRAVLLTDRIMSDRGESNISIDLIYGLPRQTADIWERDVRMALDLPVKHLSSYSLTFEDGTPLSRMLRRGEVEQVADEVSVEMYRYMTEKLRSAGFLHYEISNFALPGFESRHNSSYWHGVPYVGLGPGAHSYDGKSYRRRNIPDLKKYLGSETAPFDEEFLSEDELFNERVMTSLRTSEGLNLADLSEQNRDYVLEISQKHIEAGRMKISGEMLSLTFDGIFISNDILSDFMKV